ncbi:MAG: coniferyl aldehyde dehydrogenase [Proteobacteria bacterium]|nr:coniferyl aldehyde dehydrogenase [Pseudomonadota bacterium]
MQKPIKISDLGIQTGDPETFSELDRIFQMQKEAFLKNPFPDGNERVGHLKRLKKALVQYQDKIAAALDKDFGARCKDETYLAELVSSVEGINYTIKHVKKWVKPSWRMPGMLYMPASAKVYYQPLGVVGIIAPWNYPVYLSIGGPLVCALSAGNRAVIRMSRCSPETADVLKQLIRENFDEDHVALYSGDDISGKEFTKKPWDHMIFTGSTSAGKDVMRAAADNLTPVTLELGGKSPAIISKDVPMKDAAERIAWGKMINAGQTCVAPDYVLCPDNRIDEFTEAFRQSIHQMYPTLMNNKDYTSVENDQQYKHLQGLLKDANEKGAEIIVINPANEDFSGSRKLPVHLILHATQDMEVLQKEIFGPILPVIPYKSLEDAVKYVNDHPRPLALYFFDYNRENAEYIIKHTHSGGVLINDTMVHVPQDAMPFGGIGQSGMGQYHGHAGFLSLSKEKGVLFKPKFNSGKMIYPPYGKLIHRLIYKMLLR